MGLSPDNSYTAYFEEADSSSFYSPNDAHFRSFIVYQLLDAESAATLCDVVLRTSDDYDVPAFRPLLAAHSQYFRSLFFSDFEESAQEVVTLNMTYELLRHILIFVYTGYCAFIEEMLHSCCRSSTTSSALFPKHDKLSTLVRLSAAADYYGVKVLHRWCYNALWKICENFPASTCAVLQAMHEHSACHESKSKILALVRDKYQQIFNVPRSVKSKQTTSALYTHDYGCSSRSPQVDPKQYGIIQLSPDVLDEVLSADISSTCHEYMIQCIFFWVTEGTSLRRYSCKLCPRKENADVNANATDDANQPVSQNEVGVLRVDPDRMEWGKKFAARLNLKSMRIRFLHDFVVPTGLIEKMDLIDMLWNFVLTSTSAIQEV